MIFWIKLLFCNESLSMNSISAEQKNKMMTIYYIVHSTTLDNQQKIVSGFFDSPLSDLGLIQAYQLRKSLQNENINFGTIFCSTLRRAKETAKIIFPNHNVIEDERLKEINFGKFTHFPTSYINNQRNHYITNPFPEGESYEDVLVRIKDFLKENSLNSTITIVAHQAPQFCLEVLSHKLSFNQAFKSDWRHMEAGWKEFWIYHVKIEGE